MNQSIIDSPFFQQERPWWHPFLALFITLYGILALDWSLQPIVFLFWWDVILMSGATLIRSLFSLDGAPFMANLWRRIVTTLFGAFMFMCMIMLTVAFSIKVFDNGMDTEGFAQVPTQMKVLVAGYVITLTLHFFLNKRYQKANPIGEIMQAFIHLLILLAVLMVLTMHLIPAYPSLDQAKWVGLTVIFLKFAIDLGFARTRKRLREMAPSAGGQSQ